MVAAGVGSNGRADKPWHRDACWAAVTREGHSRGCCLVRCMRCAPAAAAPSLLLQTCSPTSEATACAASCQPSPRVASPGPGPSGEALPNVTSGFVETYGVGVCRGRYSEALRREWHRWDKENCSENEEVDIFGDDQLFVVGVGPGPARAGRASGCVRSFWLICSVLGAPVEKPKQALVCLPACLPASRTGVCGGRWRGRPGALPAALL